ncbi:LLM class F420-dependent oxidoreductase [Ktedonosporobacter rubrisoli]|uniref:LLM class F420-dependent oxidoreductase n=1 Tax=Ktedonosporobacter rubrisoli TaxID=2509675 RepID=A0A4P6K332_KTERU|nr:LLM class F420-dependent oxidoreductase [Ktedonosporobacter rubrisoli]QBD82647.1 LLM class F420-dependent oxidoreductase [Ktedonosporobacter rubrisoli]
MLMEYGLMVPQGWRMDLVGIDDPVEAYEAMTRVAQEAERLGFHSLWLFDHFHTVPVPAQEITFECWTTTAALARDTTRIRLGQLVSCNSYRNPALLAKMASTVDVLSHGRLTLGIGAGWYEPEYDAYGYEYPSTAERLRRLREAVKLIHAMWTLDEADFAGQYYQIQGAINQPRGEQKPHIPLLIGGSGEQVTLKLVAQYADMCNISNADIAVLEQKLEVLKRHCEAIGRDYNDIRRTLLINCTIGETEEEALEKVPGRTRAQLEVVNRQSLLGTPEMIRARLEEYEEAGIQEVILWFPDAIKLDAVQLFASECMSG